MGIFDYPPLGITSSPAFKSLTLTAGVITTSLPAIDATQTWNNAAVTFTGLKFNATDTASAAESMLFQLLRDSVSRGGFHKSGQLVLQARGDITPSWGNGTTYGKAALFFAPSGEGPEPAAGGARPDSSIVWITGSLSMPYRLGTYITRDGGLYTGQHITISNKRYNVDGQIMGISALADGSEPNMFQISPDVDGPAAAIESGSSSNRSALAIYNLGNLHAGTSTPYSAGYAKKSWQINGTGKQSWGTDLSNVPLTNYETSLGPQFFSATQKGLTLTANALSALLDFNSTDATSTTRNWRLATNYSAVGDFNILCGASQGADPTTLVASFKSSGRIVAAAQGTATVPALSFFGDAYGLAAPTTGRLTMVVNGAQGPSFGIGMRLESGGSVVWTSSDSNGTADTILSRSAAGIVQIGTTALNAAGSLLLTNFTASGAAINMTGLPTSNPAVAGRLWNDTGTLKVSAG